MANDTDVSALAQFRVRDIEKNGAKVQVFTLDLGGAGAENLIAGNVPVTGSVDATIIGTVPVTGTVIPNAPVYTLRYDEGATYTYIGEAAAGSAEGASAWRLKRLTNADNTILFADGNTNFDNVWSNRAALSYS